jgi:formylglycine-generating enzyme required for sulfatase activity
VWEWTSTSCPGAPLLGAPTTSGASIPAPVPTMTSPTDKAEAKLARALRQLQETNGDFDPGPGTLRGGGFEWSAESLRAWKRIAFPPNQGGISTGFRCAQDGS